MRVIVAVVVALLSLPWIAAELGFHFPGDVFTGEELGREADGTTLAAVHLGHHHGTDGRSSSAQRSFSPACASTGRA